MNKMTFVIHTKRKWMDGTAFLVLNKENPMEHKGTFLIRQNGEISQRGTYCYNDWEYQVTNGTFAEVSFEEALQHVEADKVGLAAANVINHITPLRTTKTIGNYQVTCSAEGIQFGCTMIPKEQVEQTIELWQSFKEKHNKQIISTL